MTIKMRILVASAYSYWGPFLPTDIEEGKIQVGGGETAMIKTAQHLAQRGHQVMVFYDVARPGHYNGVDYLPTDMLVPMICQYEHDALISWDNPHVFRYADRSKVRVLAFQLNDAQIGVFDHTIDMYWHPSKWHEQRFQKLYPEMSTTKSVSKITNAVDPRRYEKEVERERYRVMYSSSPDRGLHHLLSAWPKVREQVPEATLHVYYDMEKWLKNDLMLKQNGIVTVTGDRADKIRELVAREDPSIVLHGGVGQAEVAEAQMRSHVLAYPCDPVQPTEGFSMTVLEAIAAGCHVVISDADAFGELWGGVPHVTMLPLPIVENTWVDVIVEKLKEEPLGRPETLINLINAAWSWNYVSGRMERELLSCLKSKELG